MHVKGALETAKRWAVVSYYELTQAELFSQLIFPH